MRTSATVTQVKRTIGLLLGLFIFIGAATARAEVSTVAIVPFEIHAERDLSFLRDGIVDMLTTRLAWPDKVEIVAKQQTIEALAAAAKPLNEDTARSLGNKLDADYVLFGSLTIFGESVSLDAKMVDVKGSKPAVTVFNQSQGMDTVIPKINAFATDINEKIFGRAPAPSQETAPQQAQAQAQAQPESPTIFAHPDKLLGEEATGSPTSPDLNPNFVAAGAGQAATFWKSRNFQEEIKGMTVADIDGDQKQEIVFVGQNKIFAYRNLNGTFGEVRTREGKPTDNYLSVDAADINGNGKAEIFVTNLNSHRNVLESFVLEWENGDFAVIGSELNWYFRVVETPEGGDVLLGQKRGLSEVFLAGIHELTWQRSSYEPVETVGIPGRYNVYAFALGDVMGDGEEMIVAYVDKDYLQVVTKSGSKEWKSDEQFGGSINYLDGEARSGEREQHEEDRIYLPQRIFVRDLNRDGKQEVIVSKNHAVTGKLFKRFRHYSSGEIVSLSWDGLGLAANWRTRKIHGYVSDFRIADFDNDGQEELVAAVVTDYGAGMLSTPKATIISYDLTIPGS